MEVKNPYNDPVSVKARKEQEDPWVMYLVVRDSLGMSAGKTAAQVGHAVGILYGRYFKMHTKAMDSMISDPVYMEERPLSKWSDQEKQNLILAQSFEDWKEDSFRKIVLKANDAKWDKLKENLECHVVRDAGLTEVDPGSETVIGLWPMRKSQRPNMLRKLQTLK
jgi:peptidyl-tRNA hydrolase